MTAPGSPHISVLLSQKKEKGRPLECRACDAGMSHRKCVLKGVVYSMRCTVSDDLYIEETGKPVCRSRLPPVKPSPRAFYYA